ncbi:Kazal-type serine peptidase inhibitor domain 3 precursor [Danio rerio]|uniref:Kazal-type serine peptidase inhibitor domain 3 n=1 Tax=Danio rerio TaxID=7955 RepID=B0V1B1_DANRE|nr:Kazal-type serine peptidase inhibitor domain 3 precursor [Danio rerio]|eukprot:NP_001116791.1 kazal-type serine protease inhibitor domain-containing protein 1 precursor [Danio rerio]
MLFHIVMLAFLALSVRPGEAFPNYKDDYMDEDLATFDYYKGTEDDEFEEGNRTRECEECVPELCPPALGCRAGLVMDVCGCCSQCANLEGQTCDPGQRSVYYGLCGEDMECRPDRSDVEEPEAQCVCLSQDPLCGSDGQTYMNVCKYKEAAYLKPGLNVSDGPCRTEPIIKVAPHNLVNVTGSSIAFLCEVFAFPMALVEWRKEGKEVILPGDDPHISVQSRGGPQKYELSSWLQIEEAGQTDSGTYKCIARNELGHVSATAILGVLPPDEMSAYLKKNINKMMAYDQQDYDRDYY